MKKWMWYTLGGVIFSAATALTLWGVLTHKEPGLMGVCWKGSQVASYSDQCPDHIKWDLKPVPFYVDFGPSHNDYTDSVISAASIWNREIGQVLMRTETANEARITITWGSKKPNIHQGGYTVHWTENNVLHARIVLTEPSDTHAVMRYAAHEFGHALGLAHDDYTKSIMYPVQPGMTNKLTTIIVSSYDRKLLKEALRP